MWVMSLMQGRSITVRPLLQQSATTGDIEAHIDIADWLIRTRCSAPVIPGLTGDLTAEEKHRQHRETFLKAAQFVDPKYHAELEGLIEDFELEFVDNH